MGGRGPEAPNGLKTLHYGNFVLCSEGHPVDGDEELQILIVLQRGGGWGQTTE